MGLVERLHIINAVLTVKILFEAIGGDQGHVDLFDCFGLGFVNSCFIVESEGVFFVDEQGLFCIFDLTEGDEAIIAVKD